MIAARATAAACLVLLVLFGLPGPAALAASHHGCATTNPTASDANAHANVARDCEILLDIEPTLAGTGTLNWDVATAMTDWDGVSVAADTGITSISLYRRGLTGTIPSAFSGLTELTRLKLLSNTLTGSIPVELGSLANLTELSLSTNRLSGSIPTELGGLTELTILGLANNQLTGSIPVELGQLTKLNNLALSNNQLTGSIPDELGQLRELVSLSLGLNQLTGSIPSQLGQLTKLVTLAISRNQLTGSIPATLGQLTALGHLSLIDNQLSGEIPSSFGQLVELSLSRVGRESTERDGTVRPGQSRQATVAQSAGKRVDRGHSRASRLAAGASVSQAPFESTQRPHPGATGKPPQASNPFA